MILTSLPTTTINMKNIHTIFDHTFLTTTLSPTRSNFTPPMKDFIIGSDDFLVEAIDRMEKHISLTSLPRQAPINNVEQDPNRNEESHGPLDENRDFFNNVTGQTPLHSFNSLVRNLHKCHDEIAKRKKDINNKKIRNISIEIRNLKHQIKNSRNQQMKTEINNRLEDVQRSLAMETEAKEKAANMKISNFYKIGTGKMSPETFYCIKEKQASREIHLLCWNL